MASSQFDRIGVQQTPANRFASILDFRHIRKYFSRYIWTNSWIYRNHSSETIS